MFGVKKMSVKLYSNDGVLKSNNFSNLVVIPKKKSKMLKRI